MSFIIYLIRKLFLVKEIISQQGKLHFQRYRLLSTPWFNVYLHRISELDLDAHMHDHPWNFRSRILSGIYHERSRNYREGKLMRHTRFMTFFPGDVAEHDARDLHQLTLITPVVWTLVFTYGKEREWGYQTSAGWIDHQTYRRLKRANQLPEG